MNIKIGQMSHLRINRYQKVLQYAAVFIILLLWKWDGLIYDMWSNFDYGVQNMELFTAAFEQFSYGKDLLVTPYPPLSWLYKGVVPALTSGHGCALFQMIVINVLSALLRTVIIAFFWENARLKNSKIICAIVSAIVFIEFSVGRGSGIADLCILTASLMVCWLHISLSHQAECQSKVRVWMIVSAIGGLIAVPQLIKFSYFAEALALIVILSGILIARRQYIACAIFIGSYLAITAVLWILSGEPIGNLLSYVYAMLHFVKGYSEVMSLPLAQGKEAFGNLLYAIVVCGFYCITLIYLMFYNRIQAVSWFVIAPFVFLVFKEAFVRAADHTSSFAGGFLYVICYMLFVMKEWNEGGETNNFLLTGRRFWSVLLGLFLIQPVAAGQWRSSSMLYTDFCAIGSQESYEEKIAQSKSSLQSNAEYMTLFKDIAPYPNKTLGMLSGEQTFFLAYDLMDRFRINPIVSLWENFTSYSEKVVASHYYDDDAPDVLLYRPEPLDQSYFIFQMGTILQAILENYQPEAVDENGYLVMLKNEENQQMSIVNCDSVRASIDMPIDIPQTENGFVFMKVDWKLTPLGRLAAFLLKPTQASVTIKTEDGIVRDYRFRRTLAENGMYVSSLIDSPHELAELLKGDLGVDQIEDITFHANPLFYRSDFDVSFFILPFTETQSLYRTSYATLSAEFHSDLVPGSYQVFYAQNYAFGGDGIKWIDVGERQNEIRVHIPQEGWNTLRLDFPYGNAEYDLKQIICNQKIAVIESAHDAEFQQTRDGWHITAREGDSFIIFHLE